MALARSLYWQERFAHARRLLQSIDEPHGPRYWSLTARVHLATGHVDAACHAAGSARDALSNSEDLESLVRTVQAMVQGRTRDIDALQLHVRAGIAAARKASLPLQALRLRLALIEGLLDAGCVARARAAARAATAISKRPLPPLLKSRISRILKRLDDAAPLRIQDLW